MRRSTPDLHAEQNARIKSGVLRYFRQLHYVGRLRSCVGKLRIGKWKNSCQISGLTK